MKLAENPKDSIVSVWRGGVNNEFIGSAFFVAPAVLLTARHVVREQESCELHDPICLGLVQDKNQLEIHACCIHCHPDLDIALIRLQDPEEEQACSCLSLDHRDYKKCSVDCYAVDSNSGDRDKVKAYTVGTSHDLGYLFDHRVKKGFSGGAVVVAGRKEIIGVLSKRDKHDQETLFVPLYRIREWLHDLDRKHSDPVISEFVQNSTRSPVPAAQSRKLHTDIKNLAIFIDRPKEAFEHVLSELKHGKRGLKLCLCVSTLGDQDWPDEFAQALGLRLSAERHQRVGAQLLELIDKGSFGVNWVKDDVWVARNYTEFTQRCLREITDVLGRSSDRADIAIDPTRDDLVREITSKLNVQPLPKVLLLKSRQSSTNGLRSWFFADKRQRKRINMRFGWLDRFNQEWAQQPVSVGQPLVFLFCVQVEQKIAAQIQHCFRLDHVQDKCFNAWQVDVQRWLKDSGHYHHDGHLYKELSLFFRHLSSRFEEHNLNFPLPYLEFKEQIESISHAHEQSSR